MKTILLTVCCLLIAFVASAHAYLDPGTGSYVLQMAIAGIVSGLFAIKMFWRKIVEFFSKMFNGKK